MIQVERIPFPDAQAATLNDWLNHPGRLLYQEFLAAQVAEKMAEAENTRITDESAGDPNNTLEADAKALSTQARVLRAANKLLEQVVARDYKFYTVELKPEPSTK